MLLSRLSSFSTCPSKFHFFVLPHLSLKHGSRQLMQLEFVIVVPIKLFPSHSPSLHIPCTQEIAAATEVEAARERLKLDAERANFAALRARSKVSLDRRHKRTRIVEHSTQHRYVNMQIKS